MSNKSIISVKNLDKTFKLPHEKHQTLKASLINFHKRSYEKQHVLKDLNFEIKEGEFFGIVGRNGGGKSTLLKILAGIYQPTRGEVHINGSLTPFIELGVGFHSELSGRDNVFLNGAMLGMTREEVAEVYDEIVGFAELERFMDQKLKNYSSGMMVRLAFSIAIQAKTDILLVDEVLAVGDANFQAKCYDFFHLLKKNKKTVVFISHDMSAVQQYCDRAIIIEGGKIIEEGNPRKIAQNYTNINMQQNEGDMKSKNEQKMDDSKRWGNGDAEITEVYTSNSKRKSSTFTPDNEQLDVCIEFKANKDLESPTVGCVINNSEGKLVFATNTEFLQEKLPNIKAGATSIAKFTIENVLTDGKYTISCAVANSDRSQPFSRLEDIYEFQVGGREFKYAQVHPRHSFEIKTN